MRVSQRLAALALISILLAPAHARSDEIEASLKAGTRLLAEGDKLADEGKPGEAVIRYKNAFEKLLTSLAAYPLQERSEARCDQARKPESHADQGVRGGPDARANSTPTRWP